MSKEVREYIICDKFNKLHEVKADSVEFDNFVATFTLNKVIQGTFAGFSSVILPEYFKEKEQFEYAISHLNDSGSDIVIAEKAEVIDGILLLYIGDDIVSSHAKFMSCIKNTTRI